VDNCKYEIIGLLCEGPRSNEYLVRKTLLPTPDSSTVEKLKISAFFYVLLVWGVNLASLLNKRCQSWTIHSMQMVDGISKQANKEILYELICMKILPGRHLVTVVGSGMPAHHPPRLM
jgi:hypothetical protein